jgi:hypothetical protein
MVTMRARVLLPPPHDTEQSDHVAQALTWQSTGHACSLHVRVSESEGQM